MQWPFSVAHTSHKDEERDCRIDAFKAWAQAANERESQILQALPLPTEERGARPKANSAHAAKNASEGEYLLPGWAPVRKGRSRMGSHTKQIVGSFRRAVQFAE